MCKIKEDMVTDCKLIFFLFFSFSWYNTYIGLVVYLFKQRIQPLNTQLQVVSQWFYYNIIIKNQKITPSQSKINRKKNMKGLSLTMNLYKQCLFYAIQEQKYDKNMTKKNNFGPSSRGQPHSSDVNHYLSTILTRGSPGAS